MADIYVRSTDGSDTDNGSTWALAKATGAGAAAVDAAGDRVFFSQNHAESTAAAVTWAWAGTSPSPVQLICGNDAAEPPTSLATTATITTTGNSDLKPFNAGSVYARCLTFIAGSGATGAARIFGPEAQDRTAECEQCSFQIATTGSTSHFFCVSGNNTDARYKDCTFKFANAGQSIAPNAGGTTRISGGSLLSGGTSPANFFSPQVPGSNTYVDGFDFSNASASFNIASSSTRGTLFVMRNCKLPASWSGSINASTPGPGSLWEMHNCDAADTNYRFWRKTHFGEVKSETTIVRSGGASDGATPIAFRMDSNANCVYPSHTLTSQEIVRWNETTGSPITVDVEVVHDSQGAGTGSDFQDDEIWLEVQYLGTSGFPLSSFVSGRRGLLSSAADHANSSETWTTTGLASPVKQKLSVTFTPLEKGYIHAKVHLAKASKTVYVCPEPTVS